MEELEREGRALVIRPEVMPIKNTETHVDRLAEVYAAGHALAERNMDRWREWLFG